MQRYELRANFSTQQCERRYLNESFRPFSIPYDAKYVDTLEIGSNIAPDLGIEIYVWEGVDTERKDQFNMQWMQLQFFFLLFVTTTTMYNLAGDATYTSTFTTKGCLPVSDEFIRGTYYYSSHE